MDSLCGCIKENYAGNGASVSGSSKSVVPVLIIPGIGNSGPQHWQTLWESADTRFRRVQQADWDHPVCLKWAAQLDEAVLGSRPGVLLVAHSLGCLLVAHWAESARTRIGGALLVAPPDPDGPTFPKEAAGFTPLPMRPFPFKSILVASTDDPYGSVRFAKECSAAWGSRLELMEAAGHINADSNLGNWPEGRAYLDELGPA